MTFSVAYYRYLSRARPHSWIAAFSSRELLRAVISPVPLSHYLRIYLTSISTRTYIFLHICSLQRNAICAVVSFISRAFSSKSRSRAQKLEIILEHNKYRHDDNDVFVMSHYDTWVAGVDEVTGNFLKRRRGLLFVNAVRLRKRQSAFRAASTASDFVIWIAPATSRLWLFRPGEEERFRRIASSR